MTKASQTISGEIVLDELLRTLLRIVLEQGGAERACLLPCQDQGLSHASITVLRTGEPLLMPELPLRTMCVDDEHFRLVRELGTRAGLSVPLQGRCPGLPRREQAMTAVLARRARARSPAARAPRGLTRGGAA